MLVLLSWFGQYSLGGGTGFVEDGPGGGCGGVTSSLKLFSKPPLFVWDRFGIVYGSNLRSLTFGFAPGYVRSGDETVPGLSRRTVAGVDQVLV